MPIQQLNLGRALDVQTPLATIASLSRQRGLQDQEAEQNALQLQRLAQQLQESKKKADEETAVKKIIADGGEPQDIYKKLLAVNPDTARAYLTNSQADTLQAQQQADMRVKDLHGSVAPEVTASAPQTTTAAIPTSLDDPSQVSQPQTSAAATQQVPLPPPTVVKHYIGQPDTTIQPASQQQLTLAERAKAEFNKRLETQAKIAEAQAARDSKADAKIDETYQDKPDGRHRLIRMQRPDNSQYTIDAGIAAAAPQNPPQPQAARSPERMAQDEKLKTAGDDAVSLTPAGLDAAALAFAKTGQLPPMGMGKQGVAVRSKIINRAAELNPNLDTTANKADFAANQASLTQSTKLKDALASFENTALKNMQILESSAKKVMDSGSPLLNKPLRSIDEKALGDTELPVYRAARQIVVNEVAKLTNNPNLSGQLSDSARHEIESLLPPEMTLAQLMTLLPTLKQDMKNRTSSLDEQISAIRGRIKGGETTAPSSNKVIKFSDLPQ